MIRFSFVVLFSIIASQSISRTSFSQNYAPVSPGYNNPPPTQEQIDAANRRFRRIREGLPPDDDSLPQETGSTQRQEESALRSVAPPPRISSLGSVKPKSAISFRLSSVGKIEVIHNQTTSEGALSYVDEEISWPEGLKALAAISGMTTDLKNVPNGKFDCASLNGRTPAEARDFLNGLLISKGLTVIENGQKLSIVKLTDINFELVPLVSREGLDLCLPNQFVQVLIELRSLMAGPISLELTPSLSKYGFLGTTETQNKHEDASAKQGANDNQIQIVDSAHVVRRICEMISKAEQIAESSAEERSFLIDNDNAQLVRNQLLRLMELRRPFEVRSSPSWLAASPNTFRVQFRDDHENNCLVSIALPEQIEAMEAFLNFAHKAADRSVHFSPDSVATRVYRLHSINPQHLIAILSETPDFKSAQRFSVDDDNRAIVLSGSLRLHQIVDELMERFESGKRKAEIIQFHSISATQAVEVIQKVITHAVSLPLDSLNFDALTTNQDSTRQLQEFSIEADEARNRVLLWCNDGERREIHEFISRLGVWKNDSEGWVRIVKPDLEAQQLIDALAQLQAPVTSSIDASGSIVLCSQDLEKLDEAAEKLCTLVRAPNRDRDFQIKNVSASWLRINLEVFFSSVTSKGASTTEDSGIEFEVDGMANTLKVRGATSKQIRLIEWLVAANDAESLNFGSDDYFGQFPESQPRQFRLKSDWGLKDDCCQYDWNNND